MRKNITAFRKFGDRGFSIVELLIATAISLIVAGMAVPYYFTISASLRAAGDIRDLVGVTAQAKMRAAAEFTRARAFANLNGNSFQLQIWKKAGSGCWVADSDTTSTCLTYTSGAPSGTVTSLSQGDSFGFGTLTVGPTPGQTTIGQAAPCLDNSGSSIANTACIEFNSRGIPINGSTLAPIATGALYLSNGTVVKGLTVSATGAIQTWTISLHASSATWSSQ